MEDDQKSGTEMVVAMQTTDLGVLTVIRSLLDSAGVPFIIEGENTLGMMPGLSGFFNPSSEGLGAKLLVRREDFEEVQQLLETIRPA
jgi:hypothetical protein